MAVKRYVYSVRRARRNLLEAIRAETRNSILPSREEPHSLLVFNTETRTWRLATADEEAQATAPRPNLPWFVAARERAIRDLIASVRAECGK